MSVIPQTTDFNSLVTERLTNLVNHIKTSGLFENDAPVVIKKTYRKDGYVKVFSPGNTLIYSISRPMLKSCKLPELLDQLHELHKQNDKNSLAYNFVGKVIDAISK